MGHVAEAGFCIIKRQGVFLLPWMEYQSITGLPQGYPRVTPPPPERSGLEPGPFVPWTSALSIRPLLLYGLFLWPVQRMLCLANSRELFSRNTHGLITGSQNQRKKPYGKLIINLERLVFKENLDFAVQTWLSLGQYGKVSIDWISSKDCTIDSLQNPYSYYISAILYLIRLLRGEKTRRQVLADHINHSFVKTLDRSPYSCHGGFTNRCIFQFKFTANSDPGIREPLLTSMF